MSQLPKQLLGLDSGREMHNKIIPTFKTPWIHRDQWNDKDWFYSVEGTSFTLKDLILNNISPFIFRTLI